MEKKEVKLKNIHIYAILLVVFISIVAIACFFNNKLNRITLELKRYQLNLIGNSDNNNNNKDYNFGELYSYQENYNPRKEYFNYSGNVDKNSNAILDSNGVRQIEKDGQLVYNPVSIVQYGLEEYSNYIKTENEEYFNKAKIQADYLLNIQDQQNGKFYYNFDFSVSGTNTTLKAPWSSAMAQGQVISLLVRIYDKTKEEKYIEAAKLACVPLEKRVEEDGLSADFLGHVYYEEYPTNPPSYTLNGFMFTIIGLYDLYDVTGEQKVKELLDNGVNTLEFCLPFYDSDGISLYHLGHLMDEKLDLHYSERYHRVHISQLRTIYQFSPKKVFAFYADK